MWMPGVHVSQVANRTPGAMRGLKGMTCHHTVGSLASAEARFNNRASQASAHFGVGLDGFIVQWVSVDDAAFHACLANWTGWVGVEIESPGWDDPATPWDELWVPATDAQLHSCARILQWLHGLGVPMQVSDDPNVGGVTFHSMVPGDCSHAWGRSGCPGDNIINQRGQIVALAGGNLPPIGAPAPPDMSGMLVYGSSGPAVVELQQKLILLGYDLVQFGADGDFGGETQQAVRRFQADYGLDADGVVGPITSATLDAAVNAHNAPPPIPPDAGPGWELNEGSSGPEVVDLQLKLLAIGYDIGHWGADGDFGVATQAAVMAFQRDHGLDVDGIVGPLTWAALVAAATPPPVPHPEPEPPAPEPPVEPPSPPQPEPVPEPSPEPEPTPEPQPEPQPEPTPEPEPEPSLEDKVHHALAVLDALRVAVNGPSLGRWKRIKKALGSKT